MPTFDYRAADIAGKTEAGVLEAPSAAQARQILRGRGLFPVELRPSTTEKSPGEAQKPAPTPPVAKPSLLNRRISQRNLALATRQIATLLGAKLRIDEALATVAEAHSRTMGTLLLSLRTDMQEGLSFGQALDRHPKVFSNLYRASVHAGEQAGQLDRVMAHLAAHIEEQSQNRQTIQLALLYPVLLSLVSLGIVAMLMIFVIPNIVRVFTSRGAELPFLTRALISTSQFLAEKGLFLAIGIVVVTVAAGQWIRVPQNRLRIDRLFARSRLFGSIVRQMNAAQFSATLALLIASRVQLLDALTTAAQVVNNSFIRARVIEVVEKVRQGSSLSKAMQDMDTFPAMMVAMVASGETSGRLGDSLEHAARDQQRNLNAWVKTIVGLAEPLILLVMGGIVMGMVLAILLPIISLNNLAGSIPG